jgi:acyl-CoA synthetase (AMP-forming)/AMP-acid ligase II
MYTLRTIPAVLASAIERFGSEEALVDGDVRWSFEELGEQVRECAAAMIAAGVQRGDRVSVWAPNGHRFVRAALGAVTAGAVLVPVNTRYKGDEARWILAKSRAKLLLVDNGFLGNDYLAMLRGDQPVSAAQPVGGLPDLLEVISLDDGDYPATVPITDFLKRASQVSRAEVLARADEITEADVSDMFFTSGTTGRPKGAITNHGQNIKVYESYIDVIGMLRGDRYLLVNPLFHTFGYKAGLLSILIGGATLVPQATFDVDETLRLIHTERISVIPGPPTLYASILDHPKKADFDLSSLRLAMTGSASVPVRLVERMRTELFPNVIIAYGLTETCGTATVGDPNDDPETISRTVGRAIADTEVIVADPAGNELPPGQAGEVLVRGYNVMQGYFEDPQATADAIDKDGWLHTGDIGAFDEDGNLRITDRLKDMFAVGGFNAYPAEIEQTISRHEKVSEAYVVGVPDERLGEVGRAFVIPRPGEEVTEAEIIAYCRERLANFKVPRSVRIVATLPRNASGKVLKFELRRQAADEYVSGENTADGGAAGETQVAPATADV